jgi:3-deoxy-manno-octulosonate cytidylyltransferase (CMP-KDO synthetase)
MSDFHVIIPARYHSTRLEGKPLMDICGKPMIAWVIEAAKRSNAKSVHVATDDMRIAEAAIGYCDTIMTSDEHSNGMKRVNEAAKLLGIPNGDVVVNLQGDEPLITPRVINQLARRLNGSTDIVTLSEDSDTVADINNHNAVKVVCDKNRIALYFSRAPIPYGATESYERHIGIYAYRPNVLDFLSTKVTKSALEIAEDLEQLTPLYEGMNIRVHNVGKGNLIGVDTIDDLELVRSIVAER